MYLTCAYDIARDVFDPRFRWQNENPLSCHHLAIIQDGHLNRSSRLPGTQQLLSSGPSPLLQ